MGEPHGPAGGMCHSSTGNPGSTVVRAPVIGVNASKYVVGGAEYIYLHPLFKSSLTFGNSFYVPP